MLSNVSFLTLGAEPFDASGKTVAFCHLRKS
jgi:hypothetical protein